MRAAHEDSDLLSAPELWFGDGSNVEDAPVGRAEIEHRSGPFNLARLGIERPARLAQRGIDGVSFGEGAVELVGEHDGCLVADLELHADDRGQPLLDKGLRCSCKRILRRAASPLARVEHGQSQRSLIVQQHAEGLAADHDAAP